MRVGLFAAALAALPALASADAPARRAAAGKERPAAKGGAKARKAAKPHRKKKWPVRRPEKRLGPVPAMGNIPFEQGERLVYRIEMLGAHAGDAILGVGRRTTQDGRPVVPLAAWLRSSDFLSKFYPVDDKQFVVVDERTFLPISNDFYARENGRIVDYHTRFDQKERRVRSLKIRSDGGKERVWRRTWETEGDILEPLTCLYAVRRMNLKVGDAFSFFSWDGRRERFVDVRVAGREKVWTKLGWFDTLRLDITTRISGGFVKPEELNREPRRGTVWIGLDPRRTPVKMVSPTKLGEARALLVRRYLENTDLMKQATAANSRRR